MSLSSKMRKESTESNAAQAMHSPMGLHPEQGLAQLNDKGLENELPSRVAGSSDTDVPGDVAQNKILANESGTGEQSVLPADAEDASTDEDNPMTAYQQPNTLSTDDVVADADWNRSTTEGGIPATRANEPDRTLGNS
ncbi:hypothetical protein [Spirosoma montaniterrae]|uniref:Uncharacterized protein n=1 Tax=Spirosoma montaniterrae TaxID=1178516 RepID=A0A1P9WRT9_9BACT|nr:hypothetical protein [Spirosoma montaniterrae]AQG78084.1 hypothetical protein AWR27_01175 [Spirosoma montaniterrae]